MSLNSLLILNNVYTLGRYIPPTVAAPENFDTSETAQGSKKNIVAIINSLTRGTEYNKRVRPVEKSTDVLNVTLDIKMRSMLEVHFIIDFKQIFVYSYH